MVETNSHRILGAVRFIDATTGAGVRRELDVKSDTAKFVRNAHGMYAFYSVQGLETHNDSFLAPPGAPAVGSVTVETTVIDPTGEFLPRRFSTDLPRDPVVGNPNSLFTPVEVALIRAPTSQTTSTWALLRGRVVDQANGVTPLPGAYVRVIRDSDGARIGTGMADLRWNQRDPSTDNPTEGELLVAVSGIPATIWGDAGGPVLVNEEPVTLEIIFDPAFFDPDNENIPDPDVLDALPVQQGNQFPFNLASGKTVLAGTLDVTV